MSNPFNERSFLHPISHLTRDEVVSRMIVALETASTHPLLPFPLISKDMSHSVVIRRASTLVASFGPILDLFSIVDVSIQVRPFFETMWFHFVVEPHSIDEDMNTTTDQYEHDLKEQLEATLANPYLSVFVTKTYGTSMISVLIPSISEYPPFPTF